MSSEVAPEVVVVGVVTTGAGGAPAMNTFMAMVQSRCSLDAVDAPDDPSACDEEPSSARGLVNWMLSTV